MNGIKRKRIEKAKLGLVAFAILAVILTFSNILVYINLQNQMSNLEKQNTTLHSQMNMLQTEKSSLESEVSDLQTDKNNLTSLVSSLQTQVDDLQKENSQLESEIDWLNSEYDYYIATHQYANWEYEEARFDFYYVLPEEQKFGVYNLRDELYDLAWLDPYQEGVFDCSEMSAYIEWDLENKGWNVLIVVGDSPFGSGRHAWLLVETSVGKYMPVEPTTIEVVWWSDLYFDNYWVYDRTFENILDALDYSETEFDWWI